MIDEIESFRNGGIQFSRRHRFGVHHFVGHRRHRLAGKRLFAGRHPVQDYAQRKNIRAPVNRRARELFGRHECGRAQHLPGGSNLSGGQLGYAEVGDFGPLDSVGVGRGEKNIGRFDVAVNDALFMRVSDGIGDLLADFANALERQAFALFHGSVERLAVDELHHQKGQALVLADIEHSNDSRVGEASRGLCLAIKSLAKLAALLAGKRHAQ